MNDGKGIHSFPLSHILSGCRNCQQVSSQLCLNSSSQRDLLYYLLYSQWMCLSALLFKAAEMLIKCADVCLYCCSDDQMDTGRLLMLLYLYVCFHFYQTRRTFIKMKNKWNLTITVRVISFSWMQHVNARAGWGFCSLLQSVMRVKSVTSSLGCFKVEMRDCKLLCSSEALNKCEILPSGSLCFISQMPRIRGLVDYLICL